MLTAKERRFIKYWEEQRVGGKSSYLALYIIALTFIASLVVLFLFAMLGFDFEGKMWMVPLISMAAAVFITLFTWKNNEKRFKGIIKREMEEGMSANGGEVQGK